MGSHHPGPASGVESLARLATERSVRVAVAESLTSGTVASLVGAGTNASTWFVGAVIAYQKHVKEQLLGLRPDADPCSAECAEQLARGVRELLRADLAVSTTGVGGPEPQDGHAPGTVYLGWATDTTSGSRLLTLHGDPSEVVQRTAEQAIRLLVEVITNE